MRIASVYSHLNGREWLLQRRRGMWKEIEAYIADVDTETYRTKVSREKRMPGRLLFSPIELNAQLKERFNSGGWQSKTTSFFVCDDPDLMRRIVQLPAKEQRLAIEAAGKLPIRSRNQTDFVKNRVAVEVQLGKYSFVPSDIFVKHVAFFVAGEIDLGIEIVPTKRMQVEMSSGPGYFEKALHEITRQGRGVPAVPLILIGVEQERVTVPLRELAEALVQGENEPDA